MLYKIYTTEFDEITSGRELAQREQNSTRPVNSYLSSSNAETYTRLSNAFFDNLLPSAAIDIADKMSPHNWNKLEDTVVSILVDHSGSLMSNDGNGSVITRLSLELLSGVCCLLGLKHEILGFTTTSWQGGLSRRKWLQNKRPYKPGRLCDLLHINYRRYDDELIGPSAYFSNLFRRDLLKENIDGEAIEWSASRLKSRTESRKILILLSDGVPVDDSTLMENSNSFLHDHYIEVLNRINIESNIKLFGIGVNYQLDELVENSIFLSSSGEIPQNIFPFLKKILLS